MAKPKSPGQLAYELELSYFPLYHDGAPRPPWDKLQEYARQSWERNPAPREWVASALCQPAAD